MPVRLRRACGHDPPPLLTRNNVFAGVNVTAEDARFDYGEPRFTTVGVLDGRMVILVWTPRGEVRRIISMRKANEREIEKFAQALD